jgi:hypothetical protein
MSIIEQALRRANSAPALGQQDHAGPATRAQAMPSDPGSPATGRTRHAVSFVLLMLCVFLVTLGVANGRWMMTRTWARVSRAIELVQVASQRVMTQLALTAAAPTGDKIDTMASAHAPEKLLPARAGQEDWATARGWMLPPTGSEPEFQLMGIMTGRGAPIALINNQMLSVGDQLNEATVAVITASSVILQRHNEQLTVKLRR